jgi:hypothetical protein
MIRFITDDFGNLWIYNTTHGITRYYPAPYQKLEDDLHDAWGCWK